MQLEILVPVYRKDRYELLEEQGKIRLSSEVDTLSDGYKALKAEIEALMKEVNGQTRLADEVGTLEREIETKTRILNHIMKDIERATEHYKSLRLLLQSFGIDPNQNRLTFNTEHFLLSDTSVSQVEIIGSEDSSDF